MFGSPTVSGTLVAFAAGQSAAPPAFPFRGVYAAGGTGIAAVADVTTADPSGGGTFAGFAPPAVSGTTIAFLAGNPTAAGIYTRATPGSGGIFKVADTNDTIPTVGGPFGSFLLPSVSGGQVALTGFGPLGAGVFTAPAAGGPLTAVATTNTPVPSGGGARFVGFGAPAISGSVVAFAGGPNGPPTPPTGIYANTGAGGSLVRIADTTTPVPNIPAVDFGSFDPQVSVAGSEVVFIGRTPNGAPGVYAGAGGPLTEVIAAGDPLDGRTVADLGIGRESFDGEFVTFWASFTDGTSGIYVAPVPEPAGLLAAAAAAVGLLRVLRRHGYRRGWAGR